VGRAILHMVSPHDYPLGNYSGNYHFSSDSQVIKDIGSGEFGSVLELLNFSSCLELISF
jgi:hypothetical protein